MPSLCARSRFGFPLLLSLILFNPAAGQAPEGYYDFKDWVPLAIDSQAIAVRMPEAERESLLALPAFRDVRLRSIEPWPIPWWWLILVEPAEGASGTSSLIASLAADPGVDSVSPVFRDARGRPMWITRDILMQFSDGVTPATAGAVIAAIDGVESVDEGWAGIPGGHRLRLASKSGGDVLETANRLARRGDVIFAEPDMVACAEPCYTPTDPLYPSQWAPAAMNLPAAWDFTRGLNTVAVLILDDGVQWGEGALGVGHADLWVPFGSSLAPHLDTTGTALSFLGWPQSSCDNHGTLVAGCSWANHNAMTYNQVPTGIAGVAPRASHASIRCFVTGISGGSCITTFQQSWVVAAIGATNNAARTITNLSYSLPNSWASVSQQYDLTRAAGRVHFVAAGNDGVLGVTFPATLPSVIAVGALGQSGGIWPQSSIGPAVGFVAPGENILTTDRTGANGISAGDWASASGTSFACPHAAGVAALVLSVNSGLTPAQLEQILAASAVDLGIPGRDPVFGHGKLDARAAILLARGLYPGEFLYAAVLPPSGPTGYDFSGWAICVVSDVDLDGVRDFAVGAPNNPGSSSGEPSYVRLCSGATGSLIWSVNGLSLGSPPGNIRGLGCSLSNLGDVNGDGVDDVACGAYESAPTWAGAVLALSGATGALIWQAPVSVPTTGLGRSIASIEDVTGDGKKDLVAGAPGSPSVSSNVPPAVHLLNGATGQVVWSVSGSLSGLPAYLGSEVAPGPDVDGDSKNDVLVTCLTANPSLSWAVQVRSGATGALVLSSNVGSPGLIGPYDSPSLLRIQDLNGDGIEEIACATLSFQVRILSGANLSLLRTVSHPQSLGPEPATCTACSAWKSLALGAAGDITGDGIPEFAWGIPGGRVGGSSIAANGLVNIVEPTTGTVVRTYYGLQDRVLFGSAMEGLFDVNGDGKPELAVGTPGFAPGGTFPLGGVEVISLSTAPLLFTGYGAGGGDQYGWSVARINDVNGDGYDDTAIGAPLADSNGTDAGAAHVVSGVNGLVLYSATGAAANDNFGYSVSGLADLNGDGMDELAVGAPFAQVAGQPAGRVYVLSGANGAVLLDVPGPAGNGRFGHDVADAGDLNGDGKHDIAVGAPYDDTGGTDSGRLTLVSGANGSVLATRQGTSANDTFGFSVSPAGDVNLDGTPDVAAGAPQPLPSVGAGYVVVLSGAAPAINLRVLFGAAPGDLFGYDIAGGFDLNGDGNHELLVGAPGADASATVQNTGAALGYNLSTGGLQSQALGTIGGATVGSSVGSGGDLNNDGYEDFLVGGEGRITVTAFSGQTGSILVTYNGPSGATGFGRSVAPMGDANGDGVPDIIVGAPLATAAGLATGAVYSYSGLSNGLGSAGAGNVHSLNPLTGLLQTDNVLFVNGSAGGTLRNVGIPPNLPFTISMTSAIPAPFALFGMLGVPSPGVTVPVPIVGPMVLVPCPLNPVAPGLFSLADNLIPDSCGAILPSSPTPWSFTFPGLNLGVLVTFTLQGVAYIAGGPSPGFRVTNGLILTFTP